jgi:septum formation protein
MVAGHAVKNRPWKAEMSPSRKLILASASPRRRELLATLTRHFDVQACRRAEPWDKPTAVSPAAWAEALAYFKARAVAEGKAGCWVLGADTVVVCQGHLLGKPVDAADARRMLDLQAGRESTVITGVSLVRRSDEVRRVIAHARTRVWMRDDSRAIAAYVAGGGWQGKAGAYGIQSVGDRLVERVEGSFSNVVGLPLECLGRLLAGLGLASQGV